MKDTFVHPVIDTIASTDNTTARTIAILYQLLSTAALSSVVSSNTCLYRYVNIHLVIQAAL